MCTRTSEYEEELCGEKVDHKGQRQVLDAIGRMQPRVLHRLDISEDVCPERLGAEPSHIKEEEEKKEVSYLKEEEEQQAHYIKEEELEHPCTKAEVEEPRDISEDVCPERLDAEPYHVKKEEEKKEISHLKEEVEQQAQYIKEQELQHRCTKVEVDEPPDIKEEEEEEEVICKVPFTGVLMKSINEADREASSSSSCQHMTTKGVGNYQEESKADGLLAPRSDSDNTSSNADDDEKPFACTVCGQRFSHKGNLTTHTRTHTERGTSLKSAPTRHDRRNVFASPFSLIRFERKTYHRIET